MGFRCRMNRKRPEINRRESEFEQAESWADKRTFRLNLQSIFCLVLVLLAFSYLIGKKRATYLMKNSDTIYEDTSYALLGRNLDGLVVFDPTENTLLIVPIRQAQIVAIDTDGEAKP